MAGEMDYAMRPVHTHILLVGWLSMFAWGIFYSVYTVSKPLLVHLPCAMCIAGALLLTSRIYFYMLGPFGFNETCTIVYFIIGGSITLIAFVLFVVVTFFVEKKK